MANSKCKECGCTCKKCILKDHDVHLHIEIENLKQKLLERETHIVTMETTFLIEANKFPSGELVALKDELLTWQDKYRRLYDAHRRVQRVNQGLEDKLLRLVDVCETEKNTLTKDVATLSQKLAEANYAVKKLTEDNERYKKDVSLAIQFLQCKQTNFVAHKFDSLPQEVQCQVSSFMTNKRKPEERRTSHEMKSIKVPIPTFPPTAMVYSVTKSPKADRKMEIDVDIPQVDIVSAAIMAKVLEERQKEKAFAKHCDTCVCAVKNFKIIYENSHHCIGTQTGDNLIGSCVKCGDNLVQNGALRIVRSNEQKIKKVPIYPNEEINHNIVKVQPNNFLIDESEMSVKQSEDELNKNDNETNSAKNDSSDYPENASKGPRYCSMRLQSGTRNILLDNAHNNVAPVLYTRNHKKREETPKTHETSRTESCSSGDFKNNSLLSDNSTKNQQRVADWIRNNLDNEVSSSDNSRSDNFKLNNMHNAKGSDKVKYAEMEENVKRFLFGESEFMKTVEIGKMKYKSFRDDSNANGEVNNSSKSNSHSHTETEI